MGRGHQRVHGEQSPRRRAAGVHTTKSTGKGTARAVVGPRDRGVAPGQTYGALGLIPALVGLFLTRPLRPSDIIVDENVTRFMSKAAALPGVAAAASTV